jgi:hypothetical protein
MAIQQETWGKHPHHQREGLKAPYGYKGHRWLKNVAWWQGGKARYESNFTRALRSLEKRGLLNRHQEPGCHPSWTLTPAGLAEAHKLASY